MFFIPVIKRYIPTKRGKLPFYIAEEQLSHFEYSDTPIPISEIMSKICLGHLDAPCILYNHNGYYDGLKQLLRTMVEQGLASESQLSLIHFADSVEEICDLLGKAEQLWT